MAGVCEAGYLTIADREIPDWLVYGGAKTVIKLSLGLETWGLA